MSVSKTMVLLVLIILACLLGTLQFFVRRRIRHNATHFVRAGIDVSAIPFPDRWTLAVVAPSLMPLELPLDAFRPPEFRRVPTLTSLLTRDWGIKDRQGLLTVIDHLRSKGHRAHCAEVSGRPEQEFLAWDLMRAILLAWSALSLDWITRPEFDSLVTSLGSQLQDAFPDWESAAASYEAGLTIWAVDGKVRKAAARTRQTLEALLHDPESPWKATPWHTPLVVDTGSFDSAIRKL